MNLEELETSWATLEPPGLPDGINARRATGMPRGQPVYLAVDGRERRHLLIQVPGNTAPLSSQRTRGLEVSTVTYHLAPDPEALYVDLVCVDPVQNATFGAVAEDMLRVLARPHGRSRDVIISALARWRTFWSVGPEGMGRENALALFGEVWFMRKWLSPISAAVVGRWQGAEGGPYDYQWPGVSVEVKTVEAGPHDKVHHVVSDLDQMDDPGQGQLFLFSLQVREDTLATDSLHTLVESLAAGLRNDPQALADLDRKLAARGYSSADRTSPARRLRIVAERLYRVGEGFPRITRRAFEPAGLPAGLVRVGYTLDLAACEPWLVATTPTDRGASGLRPAGSGQE